MKIYQLILPFSILFFSCESEENTEKQEHNKSIDTIATDTPKEELIEEPDPLRMTIDVEKLFAKADTTLSLPLVIDSTFIDSIMNSDLEEKSLENIEAQYLGFDFVDNRPTYMSNYCIDAFIEIDSLKIKGEYEQYVESLDLGETEIASAAVIGKITELGETEFLIWMTDYSTFQACPYGHGTYIWATIFKSGKATNTLLVGEYSGGADAPYWVSTTTTSVLKASLVTTHVLEEEGGEYNEDTDEEIVNSSEKDYKTFITHGWFEAEKEEE